MTRPRATATSPRSLPLFRTEGRSARAAGTGGAAAGVRAARRAGRNARRQLGMTLVEVIVAATLALVGFLVALVLYQAARNLFKKGEQATDQQQEVRAAYDMMLKDLRLAGYNWNASGETRDGEEQIEGAWDGAITVRGDFDFEDTVKSVAPEDVIAGSTNKATVGNDEIVTYCLRPVAGSESDAVFKADVTSGTTAVSGGVNVAVRDGTPDTVTIAGIALGTAQNNPPYNLYRVTLNNDNSTYSGGGASFQTWTLLASNIKSLQFKYYDANGTQLFPNGAKPLLGDEANKDNRALIKKLDVTIVGMTAIADNKYTDPTPGEPAATLHFRKFSLTTQITPRNLGFKGRADVDTNPPTTPTGLALCPGHCGAMVAKWNANPSSEGVALYTVKYGTTSTALNQVASTSGTNIYISGLTEDQVYYFAVRASDAGGNASSYSSTVNQVVGDMSPTVTTPSVPGSFTATGAGGVGALNGRVNLAWTAPTGNTTPLACDPITTVRDLVGYRLYRSTTSAFTPAGTPPAPNGTLIAAETSPPTPPTLPATATSYSDGTVVNCRPYYYSLKATDSSCNNMSATMGSSVNGQSTSTTLPSAPTSVQTSRSSPTSVGVSWTGVTSDTASVPITIDTYKIFRAQLNLNDNPEANEGLFTYIGTSAPAAVSYVDGGAPPDTNGKRLWYKVSAIDDCPNESAKSTGTEALCPFPGTINATPASSSGLDPSPKTVTVTATGDTFAQANLTILTQGGLLDENNTITSGSPWVFTWTPNHGAGTYVATITVTSTAGCSSSITRTWSIVILSCNTCATITANDPDPSSTTNKYYRQENIVPNTCSYDLSINSAAIRARSICSSGCTTPMKLLKLQFLPTCNGGANANKSCSVAADCPSSTCNTTAFADETANVVYTAAGLGDNVSTTQTATVNFAAPFLSLKANTSNAKFRWIFNTATPVWTGTQSTKQSVLEEDLCFQQSASLCSPSCITNIRLEP